MTRTTGSIRTIGILGGGQLGRMSAMAAARLGLKTVIYTPEKNSPASHVAHKTICAPYTDESALMAFCDEVDVVTYEFENIPVAALRIIQRTREVMPGEYLLGISQNRVKEKTWLNDQGIATARWKEVWNPFDIHQAMKVLMLQSCVLKTTEMGYDGKGQRIINAAADADDAWTALANENLILEEKIDFECEISVIVARDRQKRSGCYAPTLNVHRHHILHTSTAPAPLPAPVLKQAQDIARTIAEKSNLVGVMGVEFFVTKDHRLLVNELAPRPHNSGHWTIDACLCSQFEQHIRAVAGLPLGPFDAHSPAVMTNLIGDEIHDIKPLLTEPDVAVHVYGKDEAKPGRKMGHYTRLKTGG